MPAPLLLMNNAVGESAGAAVAGEAVGAGAAVASAVAAGVVAGPDAMGAPISSCNRATCASWPNRSLAVRTARSTCAL